MAYAAVTSLISTIQLLLDSYRISVASSTREILKYAEQKTVSLVYKLHQNNTIKNNSQGVLAAEARIRDEARKLEDAIESQASAQFLSQSQIHATLFLNLDHLRHEINRFAETSEKMEIEYEEELHKFPLPAAVVSSSTSGYDRDMVGISHLFFKIRDRVVADQNQNQNLNLFSGYANVVAITGMAGTGKTTLASKIFHDPLVVENFECRAFVRVGQMFDFYKILRDIAAQLLDANDEEKIVIEGYEDALSLFHSSLGMKKYLIVLDDVWEESFRDYFTTCLSTLNGCILVTSRMDKSFYYKDSASYYHHRMELLSEEESWELLQREVFGEEEDCPPLLVKAGKKIAQICDGLPLLIVTIAKLLVKAPREAEYWKKVAEMKTPIFEDACALMYEVLLPSYHYLNQNDKACFLYLYAFPKDYAVPRLRINNLWHAEKFAEGIENILGDMVLNNVVVIRKKRLNVLHEAKACNLHIVYRHLSRRVGEDNKFLHILNRYDFEDEGVKHDRHLAIYHNTLLAIREVFASIASFSSVRSVLCTGPYHQYQVPIYVELKLLRVLDAASIRFYEFPVEVVKLIQLRYLSLTTNANLPPSINKLWFLEYLIVHQHSRINRGVAESYLPVEIWELQELDHLQIMGRNLPHPPPGKTLPKLKELFDVGVQSCDKSVLEGLPYLHKLRIVIESMPNATQTMSYDHIPCLEKLFSLRCVVKNPMLLVKPVAPPRLHSTPSSSVRKLSLSGFEYPWEDMSKIAEMPKLEVLKLRSFAFRGEKWEAKETRFSRLKYLLIEDTDLVQWTAADKSFRRLRHLAMKNCYKLREIPAFDDSLKIELDDCNPLAETCANQKVHYLEGVQVNYSWKI